MKRKGFTLIELLAVIVILAIIAIIATPIVLNIINNAKTSSNERSGELYVKAVENAIMKKQINGTVTVEDGEYTVQSDGSICIVSNNVCESGTTITIDVEGDTPESGTLTVSNGVVVSYNLVVSGTSVLKDESSDNDSTAKVYTNGEAVYFNVTTGVKCTSSEAVSETGTKSGCMKFYAFNDEGESSSTINLILDHNTTAKVAWNSSRSNSSGPSEVLTQLKSDTENWKGVETPENYINAHYNYTVDYTNYGGKARLITANEIAEITGNTSWDESTASGGFNFGEDGQETSEYAWLFDYTGYDEEYNCTSYGCNITDTSTSGYWTVSARSSRTYLAWCVNYGGYVGTESVGKVGAIGYYDTKGNFVISRYAASNGLRPVITVLKSKLN